MRRGILIGRGGIEFGGLEVLGPLAEVRQIPFCCLVSNAFGGSCSAHFHAAIKTLQQSPLQQAMRATRK